MAEKLLHCAGCNVNYRARSYDPEKGRKCPKCGQRLTPVETRDMLDQGMLDTDGRLAESKNADPLVGKTIGQYAILSKLGEGGMGMVYRAKHTELDRIVALKLLSPGLVERNPKAVVRFKREAKTAAALNDPNVVTVFAVGSDGPHHFIELEYVDGESLQDRMNREKQLDPAEATRITLDVAKGLAAAQERHMVHRDIKPANVMLTKSGQVKVMDFGLAKDVRSASNLTVSGQIMGTPYYMSPEQCEAQDVDSRADIYSTGVMYYYLLTGDLPYRGDSHPAILYKHVHGEIPDVREKCPELPETVRHIIAKAMAKKREDRYGTPREMIVDLEGVLGEVTRSEGRGARAEAEGREPRAGSEGPRAEGETAGPSTLQLLLRKMTPMRTALALTPVVVVLCVAAWQVWMGGEEAVTGEGTEDTELPTKGTAGTSTEPRARGRRPQTSEQTGRLVEARAPTTESRQPKTDLPPPRYEFWKRLGQTLPVPGPDGKVQRVPAGVIRDVEYSSEGQYLAVAHSFGVDLYDARTSKIVRRLDGHEAKVTSIDFAQDGKKLATASSDMTVRIWDVPSGRQIQLLEGHGGEVRSVALSPDGRRVASAAYDGTVRVWNAETGVSMRTLEGHAYHVHSVAFGPKGQRLASGGRDGTVRIWDANAGTQVRTLEGHAGHLDYVNSAVFSPDGRRLASGSSDRTTRIWDTDTGNVLAVLRGISSVWSVAFSPDGQCVATTGDFRDPTVRIWHAASGRELRCLKGHVATIRAVAFSPDGKRMVSGSEDGTVRVWDFTTGDRLGVLAGYSGNVGPAAFGPKGRVLASGDSVGIVRLWDTEAGEVVGTLRRHTQPVWCVAFSPDGRHLASTSDDGSIRLWDMESSAELCVLQQGGGRVGAVAFSPDGEHLASHSGKNVRLWRMGAQEAPRDLKGHTAGVRSVAFSPDGRYLASGAYSDDGTVRLWDVETGDALRVLAEHDRVYSVAFSPDGRRLASGGGKRVGFWDVETGVAAHMLKASTGGFYSVAFGPDARLLASASGDGIIRLWDTGSGAELGRLKGHRSSVHCVAFTGDGRLLASASSDGSVCLWRRTGDQRSVARSQVPGVRDQEPEGEQQRPASVESPKSAQSAISQIPSEEIEKIVGKIRTYFPTPAMKEAIRRLIEERREPFKDARVITVRQDGKGDFTSIQAAADEAQVGDMVKVDDSELYAGPLVLEREGIYLVAASGHTPTVDGMERPGDPILHVRGKRCIIEGIRFINGGSMALSVSGEGSMVCRNICTSSPVGIKAFCPEVLIVGNTCYGNEVCAIMCHAPQVRIAFNLVYGEAEGVLTGGATKWPVNRLATISNLVALTQGLLVRLPPSSVALHNVLSGAGSRATALCAGDGERFAFVGNIASACRSGILLRPGSTAMASDRNCFAACGAVGCRNDQAAGDLASWRKASDLDENSIQGDPKFVDAANYDFRLRPDSPCRGAGLNGTDIGIQWDADADYFYKLLTTPIEKLLDEVGGRPLRSSTDDLPKSFINPTDDSEMVLIPTGKLKMGCDTAEEESPAHELDLPPFYVAKHEVTNRQWKQFLDAVPQWQRGRADPKLVETDYLHQWDGSACPPKLAGHPIVNVSWFAAKAYCTWAGGRLPSEAEWEKAARGTDSRAYPWGDEWDRTKCNTSCLWAERDFGTHEAWLKWQQGAGRNVGTTMAVGSFPRGESPYGLLDMAGNVWEWTSSIPKQYPYVTDDGREGPGDLATHRVKRGGGWNASGNTSRTSYRSTGSTSAYCGPSTGLRLCIPADRALPLIERSRREKPSPTVSPQPADGAAIRIPQSAIEKIRTYFPTPAMKEAIRRLMEERRKPFKDARVISVRQDGKGDFTSIRAAIEAAKAGEVVEVADDGEYRGSVCVKKENVWLRAVRGKRPCLVSPVGPSGKPAEGIIVRAKGAIIDGLSFRHCSHFGIELAAGQASGTVIAGSEFEGCRHAVYSHADNRDIAVLANVVVSSEAEAIFVRSVENVRIACNAVVCCASSAMRCHGQEGTPVAPSGALICCNLAALHGTDLSSNINLFGVKRSLVLNNTLWSAPTAAIGCTDDMEGSAVVGNLSARHTYGMHARTIVGGLATDFNLVWRPATHFGNWRGKVVDSLDEWRTACGQGAHSMQADPRLADPEGGDFRLRPDSPCRGAGSNGADIGIQWDADADYFYKLLTTPVEKLIEEAKMATSEKPAAEETAAPAAPAMAPEEIEKAVAKIRTYFPTPAMKEAIRRLIADRRKPFKNARVITVRQDGKGDFTTIQTAAHRAKRGDAIVICDSATYKEGVSLTEPDLLLTAREGLRPTIDREGTGRSCIVLQKEATGTCVVGVTCRDAKEANIAVACELAVVALNECTGQAHCIIGNGERGTFVGNVCAEGKWGLYVPRRYWGRAALNAFVLTGYGFSGLKAPGSSGSVFDIAENLFCHDLQCGFVGGRGERAILRGNVFVANGTAIGLPGQGTTWLSRNVLAANSQYDIRAYQDRGRQGYPSVASNHNLFQALESCVRWDLEADRGTFTEWQQRLGNDLQSIQGDPKFVDPANYDFRLRPDSPCRRAGPNGTDIGIQWDGDADHFYKLLTTPIEQLIAEATRGAEEPNAQLREPK